MTDEPERHPAPDPRDDDGIRVVGDKDAQFECSICGTWVHRFSVKYHGENQYCPSCWDEVEPHISIRECDHCGEEYKYDPYESNLATSYEGEWYTKPKVCGECEEKIFDG